MRAASVANPAARARRPPSSFGLVAPERARKKSAAAAPSACTRSFDSRSMSSDAVEKTTYGRTSAASTASGKRRDASSRDGSGEAERAAAARLDREVDHHDPVLLHEADEEDDADEGVDRELGLEDEERQERAEAGEGKRRQDRERVEEVLVQDAEHHVDDEDGHEEEEPQPPLRALERRGGSLDARRDRGRQRRAGDLGALGDGVAEGDARLKVER